MRLYFAGNTAENEQFFIDTGLQHRLLTFADIDSWAKQTFSYWIQERSLPTFFLDSGAYSAFTRGATIDLTRYCEYVEQHMDRLQPYACLDVIGDWRGSARNYDIMLARGLAPVPTYHLGSPDHELRRLLSMTDYLALGGMVGVREEEMRLWVDKCFRTIRDFWPKKIHLFGVMAQWALERYPLYSTDSSGAIVGGGMGRVTVFERGRVDNYDWREYARLRYDGSVMDHIATDRAAKGSAHKARWRINLKNQLQLQRFITDLWTINGITWKD